MADPIMARTEFAAALNQVCNERGISPEAVLGSLKAALVAAFRKDYSAELLEIEKEALQPEVQVNSETGEYKIVAVDETGAVKKADITPPGFGRIASQTAKQVILQQVREAEKNAIIADYQSRMGELMSVMVLRMDKTDVIVDLGRGQGVMPPEEQVRGEFYRLNSRIAVVIADIRETYRGQSVIVSRSDPRLVKALFAREVPEVGSGVVQIKAIAREAGTRTKIAVTSTQEGVDPVGSCVGQKGVRVQAVINELNGERVDIIQHSDDQMKFIMAALAPADNMSVKIDPADRVATVTVPDDQLSLAIGRGGQNVKLAARLTGYKINLVAAQSQKTASATGQEEYEIDLLGMNEKVRNKLVDAGVVRLDQLLGENFERIREIKGIGPKSIEEIKEKLAAYQEASDQMLALAAAKKAAAQ